MRPLPLFVFVATLLTALPHAFCGTSAYRNAVLADAPLVYLEMDEAAGAATAVNSGSVAVAGIHTNVTLGQASAFANLGTSGSFNGSSSRVMVPFNAAFDLGSGNFSVEAWYKTTVTSRGDVYNFKSGNGDFGIFANNSGTGSIGGYHSGTNLPNYIAGIGMWHHVVYVRSGTTITLYVDGVSRGTGTDANTMSSNTDIYVGTNLAVAYWFNGQIDELAYYPSALSAARVLAHYNAAQQAATAPTITNGAASPIYATSATLGATVTDTGGENPAVTIFYGPTDGGTTPANWAGSVSLGAQAGAASGTATGLAQGTAHFFRARAVNSAGTNWASSSGAFTTATASTPAVQNLTPTNVTGIAATLRGEVTNIGNQPPTVTIYYGTTDGGTNASAWAASAAVAGGQTGTFAQTVNGLSPVTTYFYRCFAQNVAAAAWAASSGSFNTPTYTPPSVVINELHIAEDDATIHSEFIELYNAGATAANLSGWFFDKGINFTFPNGTTLAPGAYLVVCEDPVTMQSRYGISGANVIGWRDTTPSQWNLLSNNGELVTLRDSAGNKIDEVDYGLGFPWPTVGDLPSKSMELINPALDNDLGGSWRGSSAPTPRGVNSAFAVNAAPAIRQVAHAAVTPVAGQQWMLSGQVVRISAKVTDPDAVGSVSLAYQVVEPGDYIKLGDARYGAAASWTNLAMSDNGQNGDLVAADEVFSGLIPASVQTHRRLIRYRITAADALGASVRAPYLDDPQPNFAYFAYDGVPVWTGAKNPATDTPVTYSAAMLASVAQYHLITRIEEHGESQFVPLIAPGGSTRNPVRSSGYTGDLDSWHGALCFDGKVYDHIRFRARGGVWRYAMGKNMWKFDFNKGHDFEARDNYGQKYGQAWKKLNFSSVIQQGDFNSRGEQGLYESVGFRLFQLTGMPAEHTQFAHFRIIERPSESNGTAGQYDDDFQGLYLGIEQQDGQFLDEHDLPDGNLYKMEGGTGELNNQGPSQPKDKSDLNAFLNYGTTEQWWRENCDLPNYYNYRAIIDAIHHYDIGDGKNYFYYHNPDTNKWTALAWDLDLTWSNVAYRADSGIAGLTPSSNTTEPFFSRIFGNGTTTGIAPLRQEYRNRVREVLDLLYTPEQAGMVIDELASFIYQPGVPSFVDADRAMWDYNPILISSYVNSGKAGHGRFYSSTTSDTNIAVADRGKFSGMIQRMKNYVATRRAVMTAQLLTTAEENLVPTTPTITVAGGASATVPTNALTFSSNPFSGKNGATFSAMKWRLAEVTEPGAAGYLPYDHTNRRLYEADPANTWESPDVPSFTANYSFPPIAARVGKTYRARVKHKDSGGRWSHWSAPVSFTASAPDINVYLQGLVISQVMYHPANPTPAEQAVAQSDDSFEWIELKNVGPGPLELTPLRFTKGVDFDFAGSAVTTLQPGARVVVVNKLAAFNARYAGQLAGIQIAGEWQDGDNLQNSGEQLKLSYGAGTAIRDFVYDDAAPWPVEADNGRAMVLINPTSLPNHAVGSNWRASIAPNGDPGTGDSDTFAAWAAANGVVSASDDDDKDGLNALAEYLLVGLPHNPSTAEQPQFGVVEIASQIYPTITFRRNLAADDVRIIVQVSSNLTNWSSAPSQVFLVGEVAHGDGTSTLTYRSTTPLIVAPSQFMCLRLEQR